MAGHEVGRELSSQALGHHMLTVFFNSLIDLFSKTHKTLRPPNVPQDMCSPWTRLVFTQHLLITQFTFDPPVGGTGGGPAVNVQHVSHKNCCLDQW